MYIVHICTWYGAEKESQTEKAYDDVSFYMNRRVLLRDSTILPSPPKARSAKAYFNENPLTYLSHPRLLTFRHHRKYSYQKNCIYCNEPFLIYFYITQFLLIFLLMISFCTLAFFF